MRFAALALGFTHSRWRAFRSYLGGKVEEWQEPWIAGDALNSASAQRPRVRSLVGFPLVIVAAAAFTATFTAWLAHKVCHESAFVPPATTLARTVPDASTASEPPAEHVVAAADTVDETDDSAPDDDDAPALPPLEILDTGPVSLPPAQLLLPVELSASAPSPRRFAELERVGVNNVVVRDGSVGDEVLEVDLAVDRLTDELLNQLEAHKLLVVWVMDASLSLSVERHAVSYRLEQIYHELAESGRVPDDALKSAVVAFGQQTLELAEPTTKSESAVQAIHAIVDDTSGIENVFSTILWCVEHYKRERIGERRRLMLVVWTDESGNDHDRLEEAVKACRISATPVYVVGPSAMFGVEKGTLDYLHVNGKRYRLPVDRGPDTAREERIRLPYWFEGEQYESLHAGLGPFALTRLAQETGGAYLIKDQPSDRSPFPAETMRRYMPEYDSPLDYERRTLASPVRRAVLAAVDVTQRRKFKGTPRLRFAPSGQTFFNELREAQETVAYDMAVLQQALEAFGTRGLEQAYQRETSPRWRAWYDLTLGRLLAMSVRASEYNWACAEMKAKGADFVEKKSNRWEFKPDAKLHFGSQSEKFSKEAKRLLTRCVNSNPDTPWALLAQRELEQPFGFRVEEAYEAPPPPPPKMKAPPAPPPALPPPPPTGRVMEQRRKLEKPVEVPLPKL